MAEGTEKQVGTNKTAENLLSILGAVGQVAGPLIFGPDFQGNLGAPFQVAAMQAQSSRMSKGIEDAMKTHPETKALLDDIQATHAQGGLMNALSSQGQSFGPSAPQGMSGLATGGSPTVITPQMTSMTPADQAPQQAPQQYAQSVDFTSPETIARFARVNPALAEKLILEAANNKPTDPIEQSLALLKLRDYESPEQKRERDLAKTKEILGVRGDIVKGRIGEQKSYLQPKEIEDITNLDTAVSSFKSLPDQFPKTSINERALLRTGEAGRTIVSYTNKDIAELNKRLTDANADRAFKTGGKQLTGVEKDLVFTALPNLMENPDMYPIAKQAIESKLTYMKLARLDDLAKTGRNVTGSDEAPGYLTPEQLEDFRVVRSVINKAGSSAFKDPEFMQVLDSLGLAGIAMSNTK